MQPQIAPVGEGLLRVLKPEAPLLPFSWSVRSCPSRVNPAVTSLLSALIPRSLLSHFSSLGTLPCINVVMLCFIFRSLSSCHLFGLSLLIVIQVINVVVVLWQYLICFAKYLSLTRKVAFKQRSGN